MPLHRTLIALMAVFALAMATVVSSDEEPAGTASEDVPVVTTEELAERLARFQAIADTNDGNRAAGTPGYAASAEYVARQLTEAGFEVTRQTCTSCESRDDNVIADWPGGDPDSTVLVGAHLDGVREGAGINDNGSGSVALLASALAIAEADMDTDRHLRFAWWAEEEPGYHGSEHYVSSSGVDDLVGYVNLDMVGGPNPGYFVGDVTGPMSQPFADQLESAGISAEKMTGCCSDDRSFARAGVPTTTLSTGYGELKSIAQAGKWGPPAGEPFDPCIHTSCDAYPENIDLNALAYMANAATQGVVTLVE